MNWHAILKDNFGYETFISPQHKIVRDSAKHYDQLVVLPTGSGKSLCYQLPAIAGSGFTIIISPLKALIKDQIDNLRKRGIPVLGFYGDTSVADKSLLLQEFKKQEVAIHLIYTTPETIENNSVFKEHLHSLYNRRKIDRFVIDEAHCISQWGNNFRPSYRALENIRLEWETVPIMALTATAPPAVQKDITKLLKFGKYKYYTKSYFRKNLDLTILEKASTSKKHNNSVLRLLSKYGFLNMSGIIYCQTRKKCELLEKFLNSNGLVTKAYHAGFTKKYRMVAEDSWKKNEINIIIATIAFGMGIDKADVRFIIHNDTPFSVESYYQEIGRGGRDGLPTKCFLYYSELDRESGKKLINWSFRKTYDYKANRGDRVGCADCKTNLSHTIKLLDRFERLCINTTICRHVLISKYLGEADLPACGTSCDTCRKSHDDKPTINGINLCRDILNIIENLRDSAYRSNIIRVFKQIYLRQYKGLFGTQKRSLDMVRKALVHLRINKYIRERVIQLPGTNRSVVTYQLYNKSKTLRDPTSSIQLEL